MPQPFEANMFVIDLATVHDLFAEAAKTYAMWNVLRHSDISLDTSTEERMFEAIAALALGVPTLGGNGLLTSSSQQVTLPHNVRDLYRNRSQLYYRQRWQEFNRYFPHDPDGLIGLINHVSTELRDKERQCREFWDSVRRNNDSRIAFLDQAYNVARVTQEVSGTLLLLLGPIGVARRVTGVIQATTAGWLASASGTAAEASGMAALKAHILRAGCAALAFVTGAAGTNATRFAATAAIGSTASILTSEQLNIAVRLCENRSRAASADIVVLTHTGTGPEREELAGNVTSVPVRRAQAAAAVGGAMTVYSGGVSRTAPVVTSAVVGIYYLSPRIRRHFEDISGLLHQD